MAVLLETKVTVCYRHIVRLWHNHNGALTHLNTSLCDFIHIQVFIDDHLTLHRCTHDAH